MMMFYYFLAMIGILANAWAFSYDKGYSVVAVATGLVGVLASAGAICFDVRNRQMSQAAEGIMPRMKGDTGYGPDLGAEAGNLKGPVSADGAVGAYEEQNHNFEESLLKDRRCIRPLVSLFPSGSGVGVVLGVRDWFYRHVSAIVEVANWGGCSSPVGCPFRGRNRLRLGA